MPTRTVDPLLLGRFGWTVLSSIAVLSVLAGIAPLTGIAVTWFPILAVPAAAGLPHLIPALSATPPGDTSWLFWAFDTAGAVAMLLTAYILLRSSARRCSPPRRGRAFGRGLGVTVLSVIVGNLVRTVAMSFVVQSDLGTFIGTTLATVVVSALFGALLGIGVGLVGALIVRPDPSR